MSDSSTPHRPRTPRIPPFFPVPLRGRHDGWTAELQGHFIGYLAETAAPAGDVSPFPRDRACGTLAP